MKPPPMLWWCGYWRKAVPSRSDIVDFGEDCPHHYRNDERLTSDGRRINRGCRWIEVKP